MLNGPGHEYAPEEVFAQMAEMHLHMPAAEYYDITWQWPGYWRKFAADVEVPVLHMLEEQSGIWGRDCREKQVELVGAFEKLGEGDATRRLSTMLVAKAPHCLELSYAAQEVVMTASGWAIATGRAKPQEV